MNHDFEGSAYETGIVVQVREDGVWLGIIPKPPLKISDGLKPLALINMDNYAVDRPSTIVGRTVMEWCNRMRSQAVIKELFDTFNHQDYEEIKMNPEPQGVERALLWIRKQVDMNVFYPEYFGETAYQPGDQVMYFTTPRSSWMNRAGRAGFLLLREGKPIRSKIIMMS